MPENKELPQPRNILEAINQNIYLMNENILTLLHKNEELEKKLVENQQELIALKLMFNVPEKPNAASGDEGTSKESIGSTTKKPSL